MTTDTAQTNPANQRNQTAAHQYTSPRPGRSRCDAVTSYECLAPAGYRNASGTASVPGVRRSDLHTCGYCQEPVCHNCSTQYGDKRVCDTHSEDEILDWVDLFTNDRPTPALDEQSRAVPAPQPAQADAVLREEIAEAIHEGGWQSRVNGREEWRWCKATSAERTAAYAKADAVLRVLSGHLDGATATATG